MYLMTKIHWQPTMFSLSTDTFRYIATYLDHRSLLDLETACKWLVSLCNDEQIWRDKLRARVRRELSTLDPKGMYRRALKAGSPRFFIGADCMNYGCLPNLEQRRDIVKVSCWPDEDDGDVAVAITLEGRCLLYRDEQEPEDIGPAEDAWIHRTYTYCAAILNEGQVHILRLEARRDRLTLDLHGVDRIVGFTQHERVLYLVCLVKGGDLIRVRCSFPPLYETIASSVCNAFVVDAYDISWSRDGAKYLFYRCITGQEEIRAHLNHGKLRYAYYNRRGVSRNEVVFPCTGETTSRQRVPSALLEQDAELDNVQDIALYQGDLLALINNAIYMVDDMRAPLVGKVLWMRPSDEMMSYVTEPQ